MDAQRQPTETIIDIHEGQKGISYARLFRPYLAGAKAIKLVDPYIRLQYQQYNFMSFCEIIEPPEEGLTLTLLIGCDPHLEAELRHKMEDLKIAL